MGVNGIFLDGRNIVSYDSRAVRIDSTRANVHLVGQSSRKAVIRSGKDGRMVRWWKLETSSNHARKLGAITYSDATMKDNGRFKRRLRLEPLEQRFCLSASVGWDGPGLGDAALTYYIPPVPSSMELTQQEVEAGLEQALDVWSTVADITFTQTFLPNQRDSIDFEFMSIDGRGGTLAQAYFPDDINSEPIAGDVEFDTAESWEIGHFSGTGAYDLVLVAAHEIGHSLGLEHSDASGAIMQPTISPNQEFDGLGQSDIDAILGLYAPGSTLSLTSLELDQAVIAENEYVVLSGSFFDAAWGDNHVVTVDWGDGSIATSTIVDELDLTFDAFHRYLDDGESWTGSASHTITVRIEDTSTGNVDTATTIVTVENVAPTVTDLSVTTVEEGSAATITGIVNDPGSSDTFTVTIDWGDGSKTESFTYASGITEFSETHTYVDDPGGILEEDYTITVSVTDDDLGSYIGLATATVLNSAPEVMFLGAPTSSWLGQRIELQTEVTDAGVEDIHSYHWEVSHNGLRYTEGDGADFSFVPTRDGIYGVTVTVDDGDGGTDSTMARIVVDGDLGNVEFLTLDALRLADDQLHFSFRPVRSGIVTLEALAADPIGGISIVLYDQNPLENEGVSAIAMSDVGDVVPRIDQLALDQQTYYIQLEGTNADFALRVTNLVNLEGTDLSVFGTEGDDDFLFNGSTGRQVVINEVSYEFSEAEVTEIEFLGGDGYDTVVLRDSPGDDALEAWPTVAVLSNSLDDDVADFTVNVSAFEEMHVYAKSDGHDTAVLHDSENADKFKAEPGRDYAKMYGGSQYNRVKFFDVVEAYSSEGDDLARIFDTETDDAFEGQKDTSHLSGAGFDVLVHGFRQVIIYASQGTDTATFVDSELRDEFHAKPWKSQMFDVATDVYEITARRFDSVRAEATNVEGIGGDGGQDIAKIWPSGLDDFIEASEDWFRFDQQEAGVDLLYEAIGFETIRVRDTAGGNDTTVVNDPLAYDLILGEGWE